MFMLTGYILTETLAQKGCMMYRIIPEKKYVKIPIGILLSYARSLLTHETVSVSTKMSPKIAHFICVVSCSPLHEWNVSILQYSLVLAYQFVNNYITFKKIYF